MKEICYLLRSVETKEISDGLQDVRAACYRPNQVSALQGPPAITIHGQVSRACACTQHKALSLEVEICIAAVTHSAFLSSIKPSSISHLIQYNLINQCYVVDICIDANCPGFAEIVPHCCVLESQYHPYLSYCTCTVNQ